MRGGSTIVFGWAEIGRMREPNRGRACENAGLRARRFDGFAAGLAACIAPFVIYARLVLDATATTGPTVDHFLAPVVSRIFFINLGAFARSLILKAAGAAVVIVIPPRHSPRVLRRREASLTKGQFMTQYGVSQPENFAKESTKLSLHLNFKTSNML